MIAEKKGIKLADYDFRYFRYAKNRISIFLKYRYLSKIVGGGGLIERGA